MVDQQYLLNDEGVQNFIKNGYIALHPDLPDLHEEIYRETAAIFEKEGRPAEPYPAKNSCTVSGVCPARLFGVS